MIHKPEDYDEMLQRFHAYVKKIEYLKYTLNSLIYWDKITKMPEKGIQYRSEVMSYLGEELYKLFALEELQDYVSYFEKHGRHDLLICAMVKRIKRNYIYVNQIPEKEYSAYISLIATAEPIWEKAKIENDFALFAPYLEKIVASFRGFAEHWGYETDPYDALMGYYEEGITVDTVDDIIAELRDFLVELLDRIQKSGKSIREDYFLGQFTKEQQKRLSEKLLASIGFDFEAGRLDESSHPTTLANSPDDVRVVTSYSESDLRPALFNALHEGGKGIYEQDIDRELLGSLLAEVASMGLEEAEARLYENIVGRSKGFWTYFYTELQSEIPALAEIPLDEFYEGINVVKPSLIRIDADELTYVLHIIIRYEIEKDLINGKIQVKDLPEIWSRKYEEYLKIKPETDSEGVLQDIQWAAGYFGFFPSYLLSNLYAAQFTYAMNQQIGDLDEKLRDGRMDEIHQWLKENVHKYGAVYTPEELVLKVSGEKLKSSYYINYLRKKYYEVYDLF